MEKNSFFEEMLKIINLTLSNKQIDQFKSYYEMLIERNKVMNLTAITDYNEVVIKHFIDSMSIVRQVDLNKELKIIDIGTGAGFPGIPLKIAFPHLDIVLLDSLNKRLIFLNDVIDELNLNNPNKIGKEGQSLRGSIRTIHGRAEDFAQLKEYRETFDLCVSRAVASLSTLSEYCLPYVKIGGSFISYKAGDINEEIEDSKKAIGILGGKIQKIDSFKLPDTDIDRTLVKINKTINSPRKYPRTAGTPKRQPIK